MTNAYIIIIVYIRIRLEDNDGSLVVGSILSS